MKPLLFILLVSAAGAGVVNTNPTHMANSIEALNIRVACLERQVRVLERARDNNDGEIQVYYVDSAAGEIKCRSCEWVKER